MGQLSYQLIYFSKADNLLKLMHGQIFAGLPKLVEVKLNSNVCISRQFSGKGQILNAIKVVTDDCGSKKAVENELHIEIKNLTEIVEQNRIALDKCGCKAEM
jgi:hypothetical protein